MILRLGILLKSFNNDFKIIFACTNNFFEILFFPQEFWGDYDQGLELQFHQ